MKFIEQKIIIEFTQSEVDKLNAELGFLRDLVNEKTTAKFDSTLFKSEYPTVCELWMILPE